MLLLQVIVPPGADSAFFSFLTKHYEVPQVRKKEDEGKRKEDVMIICLSRGEGSSGLSWAKTRWALGVLLYLRFK